MDLERLEEEKENGEVVELVICHLVIHLTAYWLSAYHVPSTILGRGYTVVNKTQTGSCPHVVSTLVVERKKIN